MSVPLFYEPLANENLIQCSSDTIHHAYNVLRMKVGAALQITNGKGLKADAVISSISKKELTLHDMKIEQMPNDSAGLHLAIAFTKHSSRMEWMLEKITEIGVQRISPLLTHRSEKQHIKRERWEKILVSAMLQSQKYHLPILHDPQPFSDVLNSTNCKKLIAYCGDEFEKSNLLTLINKQKEIMIMIGPEGDFAPEEVRQAIEADCKVVSLGTERLRTETAGLYACAAFSLLRNS